MVEPTANTRAPRGLGWPVFLVGLLLANVGVCAVTFYLATSDRSVAVEPDYDRKALHFDQTARQNGVNLTLGWKLEPTVSAAVEGRAERELSISLRSRTGAPLDGATVNVVAFHQARSGDRFSATLGARGEGVYGAAMPLERPGYWELRFTVSRPPDTFTQTSTLRIDGPAPATGAAR